MAKKLSNQDKALESAALAKSIHPMLAGHHASVQSAAIADLMATWLAGHFVKGNESATTKMRALLFDDWINLVKLLIPEAEKELLASITPANASPA